LYTASIRTVRERIDFNILRAFARDSAQASECVDTVDVHGTRATNTLTARATESQCWVYLILDLDESIKYLRMTCYELVNGLSKRVVTYHRSSLVQVNGVALQSGLLGWLIRILRRVNVSRLLMRIKFM